MAKYLKEESYFRFKGTCHFSEPSVFIWFEIYKNVDGQYLVTMEHEDGKSIRFYPDFDMLKSVFCDDIDEKQLTTGNNVLRF